MRRLISVALVCLCAGASPVFAETEDAEAAKVRYEAGVKHFDLAEYEPALADFKEAYRQKADPAFLYNIAQCHRRLGHTDDAITFYQNYLRRSPDAKNREEVQRRISELEAVRRAGPEPSTPVTAQPIVAPPVAAAPPTIPAAQPAAIPPTPTPVSTSAPSAALDFSSYNQAPPANAGAFYTRWWFWTAVGVVTAGAATVAIMMAKRDPTQIPNTDLGSRRVLQ